MRVEGVRPPEKIEDWHANDALSSINSGRNIAHLLMFAKEDAPRAMSAQEIRNIANEDVQLVHGSHTTPVMLLSKSYSFEALKVMPDSVVFQHQSRNPRERLFEATDFARTSVFALAAFVTDLCIESEGNVSPYGLVGSSRGKGTETTKPFTNRITIYRSLLRRTAGGQNIKPIDLMGDLDISRGSLQLHLNTLRTQQIIEGEDADHRIIYPAYRAGLKLEEFTSADLLHAMKGNYWHAAKRRLARRIFSDVKLMFRANSDTEVDIDKILDEHAQMAELFKGYHGTERRSDHRRNIASVLSFFTHHGLLIESEPTKKLVKKINLVERELLEEYLAGFRKILMRDPETIEYNIDRAHEIANNPRTIAWLLNADYENGVILAGKSLQEKIDIVNVLFQTKPVVSTADIAKSLGITQQQANTFLSKKVIDKLGSELVPNGKFKRIRKINPQEITD